jgi:outer membrane protein OmpA-like peptidoglycan-associated protein
MHRIRARQCPLAIGFLLSVCLGWATAAFADDHLRGVITRRDRNGSFVIQTDDRSDIMVVMTDATKVRRIDGFREKKMSSAALAPGLRVEVAGRYEGATRFAAKRVEFSRTDLKVAQAVRGGLTVTDERSVANQQRLDQQGHALQQQGQAIDQHGRQIETQRGQISAADQRISATTGALAARISNLDNYNVISQVTVYFPNAKATIAPKYVAELQQLASQAKDVNGYVVQIQGFASAVGPDALNQRLSKQRADAVTAVLQQSGVIPANVIVPAAMGISEQVASNKTSQGQAENRRAVVSLLQNKGIADK